MSMFHNVKNIHFDSNFMIADIDGQVRRFNLDDISSILANATEEQRNTYDISPSGYGIHWPLIDEDLSVKALLNINVSV